MDGSLCPNDAKLVDSPDHDACITWRLANGTVLFQNVVRFDEECKGDKVVFWSNFIDLFYKDSGGSVDCCSAPGTMKYKKTPAYWVLFHTRTEVKLNPT